MRPPLGTRAQDVRREGRQRDAPQPGERAADRPARARAQDRRVPRLRDVQEQARGVRYARHEFLADLACVPLGVPVAGDRREARDGRDPVLALLRRGRTGHRKAPLVGAARPTWN